MVLCEGGVNPVMSRQDVLIEPGVHSFPRTTSGERPSASHERVQDSKRVEVGVEVGGAFAGEDDVGQIREGVGSHYRRSFSLHLGQQYTERG